MVSKPSCAPTAKHPHTHLHLDPLAQAGGVIKYLNHRVFNDTFIRISLDFPRVLSYNICMSDVKLSPPTLKRFDTPETLVVLSSFPKPGSEIAKKNAVARYTSLLLDHLPAKQQAIVLCERDTASDTPYLLTKNILVVPCYTPNTPQLYSQILRAVAQFSATNKLLLQLELSTFGNPLITMGFIPLLALLKRRGFTITTMLHQVVLDVTALGGHISASAIKKKALNAGLGLLYRGIGRYSDRVLVHDDQLKQDLVGHIDPQKTSVIHHGIASSFDTPSKLELQEMKQLLNWKSNEVILLQYGYLSRYKGSDWVVDAVGKLAKKHPEKNIKLVLAGSYSPTQQHTKAYQEFKLELERLLVRHRASVVTLGFVPERQVPALFTLCDVLLFPYRGRMSASGALSLAWQYQKPFLVSTPASQNLQQADVLATLKKHGVKSSHLSFSLNSPGFEKAVMRLIENKKLRKNLASFGKTISLARSWSKVAQQYLDAVEITPLKVKTSEKLSSLSLFFPMHNEEENVAETIKQALNVAPTLAKKFEVIIVNDGSTDQTTKIAHAWAKKDHRVRVVDQLNLGYGGALQAGFNAARNEWVFFSDGDLQFDLKELQLLVNQSRHSKAVIGYRKQRADTAGRTILARLLKLWNTIWFQFPSAIKDIDCAFKLFHRSVIQQALPLRSTGAMISTELLLAIYDMGEDISQVGVTHLPRSAGTQTGASWHVVKGAMLETLRLFYVRSLESRNISLDYNYISSLLAVTTAFKIWQR